MSKPKPEFTLRDGALKVTCWKNDSENGAFYSVDLIRSYKDSQDEWQVTSSLSGSDILRGGNLLTEAYNRIRELRVQESNDQ